MNQAQDLPSEEKSHIAGETMESLGNPDELESNSKSGESDLPVGVKERLGRQEKRHQKAMRDMQSQIQQLHSQLSSGGQPSSQINSQMSQQMPQNPYNGQPIQPGSHEEMIHKAVSMALAQKEQMEQQAKQAESKQYLAQQYQGLKDKLDTASDKYDDFDDVVRSNKVPFTETMRDASLLLPNPEDVLYKLGKNPEELARITKLHPIDQTKEMMKLSFALMGGKPEMSNQPKQTLGNIKSTPINSSNGLVTENTPAAEIRARMKAGKFK